MFEASNDDGLRTGDLVEVRGPGEILATLDADGALDGLPFMPEMSSFCGQRVRVLRRAEKTCVEMPLGRYAINEFRRNDVLVLELPRCSGADHDGCQRLCTLFWKAAWLRKIGSSAVQTASTVDPAATVALRSRLKTRLDGGRYFCQSTELAKATQHMSRSRILLKCLVDIRSGSRGVLEMAWLIIRPLWRKATGWYPRPRLTGPLKKTPVGNLNLQCGELVQIRSAAEISETLDARGRNRGLICDYGMTSLAGRTYAVRSRLDRMISESTGEMRSVEGTVILEDATCFCWNTLGGCPRQDFMYWRELWLKRVTP